jgi:alpha-glucoside transport system substrate-binding protein
VPSESELKVFLMGRVAVEAAGVLMDEERFPGRQGRLLFACLVLEQGRPVPRDELAEVLWEEAPPATWEKALTVLVSKLRVLLADLGVDDAKTLTSAFGCYRLSLPEGTWVDVIAADHALRKAEAALETDDAEQAKTVALHAASLARPTFMPGEDGAWVEAKRRELVEGRRRALSCLAEACLRSGDEVEAAKWAEETIALEPYRETGYRQLMAAHAAAGNRAEALRVYERCRVLLATELGAYPSPETESVYRELLRAPASEGVAASSETRTPVGEPELERAGTGERAVPPPEAPGGDGRGWRRRLVLVGLLVVGAVTATSAYLTTRDESSLGTAQNPITIFTPWFEGDPEHRAFVEVLRAFEETTGLETETVESGDARIVPGYRPSVGFTQGPGQLGEFVRDGTAEPLASLGVTDAELARALGRSWIELGTVDGQIYGLPLATTSKSLVWYRPRQLRRLGLRPARTWNELVLLTERLARDGRKPWALGGSDAFTLTDWFENVYIRTEGQWKYDGLFAGKLPFDDPSVIRALNRMTTLLNEDYLAAGVDGALTTPFLGAVAAVFGSNRRADLLMEGGFVGSFALELNPAPVPGATIAVAPFPSIDRSFGNPVVAGGDFLVAFEDAAAVRRLLAYLMSPGAGRIWVSHGTVVSTNKLVPLSAYPNELVRTAARQVITARVVRFDGSDLLPAFLGDDLGRALQKVIRRPAAAPNLMKEFQRTAERSFDD